MIVHTSRFGTVEVDDDRVIMFARGILGFPRHKGFVLIQPEADATFYWLQSVDAADLAFVVTDPLLFVPDCQVPLREETRQELSLADLSEANVLVIVNKVGDTLTANLQGPLVTAWELKQAFPEAELRVIEGAGHSSGDAGMTEGLVEAFDRFAMDYR